MSDVRQPTQEEELADELLLNTLKQLVLAVKSGDCQACGRTAATPQELAVAVRFLNDHGITISKAGAGKAIRALPQLPYPVVDPEVAGKNLGRKLA